MIKNNRGSKIRVLLLMYLYYQIIIFYLFGFIILLSTNGVLSTIIYSNFLIFLLPSILPITMSLIGITHISTYSSSDLLKIKTTNLFFWFFKKNTDFKYVSSLPSIKVKEKSKILGLRKELYVTTKPKNTFKLNVSILSREEREELIKDITIMKSS